MTDIRENSVVALRPAQATDCSAVGDMLHQLQAAHAAAMPGRFLAKSSNLDAATFLRCIRDDDNVVVIAERDGDIVGSAHAYVTTLAEAVQMPERRVAFVRHVFTLPGARRAGVATAMMRAIADFAGRRGAACVELAVWGFNDDATAFYRALGYTTQMTTLALPLDPANFREVPPPQWLTQPRPRFNLPNSVRTGAASLLRRFTAKS